MGDYADAVIECFGSQLRERLAELFDPYTHIYEERPEHASVAIEHLGYGEEGPICTRLEELAIPYAFFHCGDHEHVPFTRLYAPGFGEWRGAAGADGEVLIPANALDGLADEARQHGCAALADKIDDTSARPLREFIAARHGGSLTSVVPTSAVVVSDPRRAFADRPIFTYVDPNDRYLVVLAVSYDHDDDPTDTGERVASPRDAAHWALELTRDGGCDGTQWAVFDTTSGEWIVIEQTEMEEA